MLAPGVARHEELEVSKHRIGMLEIRVVVGPAPKSLAYPLTQKKGKKNKQNKSVFSLPVIEKCQNRHDFSSMKSTREKDTTSRLFLGCDKEELKPALQMKPELKHAMGVKI